MLRPWLAVCQLLSFQASCHHSTTGTVHRVRSPVHGMVSTLSTFRRASVWTVLDGRPPTARPTDSNSYCTLLAK